MRSDQGFSYQKPDQYRESQQTTAIKYSSPSRRRVDQTQQYTPTRSSRKPNERISNLKNSINKCIEELSNKKEMNREALQQVKDVNKQAIDSLSYEVPDKVYRSNHRHVEIQERPPIRTEYAPRYDQAYEKERQHVTLSSFHLIPANQNQLRPTDFHSSQIYRPQSHASNQYEIQDLRQKIKNERMQNQGLQRHLQQLQNQQSLLRNSPSNNENQQNFYLIQQNLRLREQLARIENQQNLGSIYQEFQRLKEDNEKLRKQTINLLKSGRY